MANAYVIVGYTGEYADIQEWVVAVSLEPAPATAWVDARKAQLEACGAWFERENPEGPAPHLEHPRTTFVCALLRPVDPQVRADYTGVGYRIETVPVL